MVISPEFIEAKLSAEMDSTGCVDELLVGVIDQP